MNKRKIGDGWECLVIDYLEKNNVELIERNFYTKHGELDLIYKDGEYLVFAEVKERNSVRYGNPLEAVTYKKMQSMYYSARVYIYTHEINDNTPMRFDVIGILNGEVYWVKNAFST